MGCSEALTVDGVRCGDTGVQQRLREALPRRLARRRAAAASGAAAQPGRSLHAGALIKERKTADE